MLLIFGLGNPGEKYEKTRHNTGFDFLEEIRKAWDFPEFKLEKKFNAEISAGKKAQKKILLVKPQTFMNLSGIAVKALADFYKLGTHEIIIIHDDLDIALGEWKLATDSRSAGHNGVQNIIENLNTQKFRRFRIGIRKSKTEKEACPLSGHEYVLQKFSPEETEILKKIRDSVLKKIETL